MDTSSTIVEKSKWKQESRETIREDVFKDDNYRSLDSEENDAAWVCEDGGEGRTATIIRGQATKLQGGPSPHSPRHGPNIPPPPTSPSIAPRLRLGAK